MHIQAINFLLNQSKSIEEAIKILSNLNPEQAYGITNGLNRNTVRELAKQVGNDNFQLKSKIQALIERVQN